MTDPDLLVSGATHQVYRRLLDLAATAGRPQPAVADDDPADRDRGAVSLEQVLWFVAAGVSVAVIAAILWAQIREQAETDPIVPESP